MALLTKRPTANALLRLLDHQSGEATSRNFQPRVGRSPRHPKVPWMVKWWEKDCCPIVYIPPDGGLVGQTLDFGESVAATADDSLPDVDVGNWFCAKRKSSTVATDTFESVWAVFTVVNGVMTVELFWANTYAAADYPDATAIVRVAVVEAMPNPESYSPPVISQLVVGALSFGGGGGGIQQTLGPLVYEKNNNRIAQYMGTWAFTAPDPEVVGDTGSWSFVKATNAEGKTLPPAAVYSAPTNTFLVRMADGSNFAIGRITLPVLFSDGQAQTKWLARQTAAMVHHAAYTAPGDEYGTGGLTATNATITYFDEVGQQSKGTEVLLHTITEDAQTVDTYEQDSGE